MVDNSVYTVHPKHGKIRSHAFHNLGNEDEHAHKTLHEVIDRELASDDANYNSGIICDVCEVGVQEIVMPKRVECNYCGMRFVDHPKYVGSHLTFHIQLKHKRRW